MHIIMVTSTPWQNPEKSNDPIPRKHPDVRKQGWTDPISWNPLSYRQWSNRENCNKLAFKSQKYRV